MVLIGKRSATSATEFVLNACVEYKDLPTLSERSGRITLWVLQREYATAAPSDGIECIGSQEATTCVILSLRNAANGLTSVCHLDGYKTHFALIEMVKSILEDSEHDPLLEVCMIGGYEDERDESIKTITAIAEFLCECPVRFDLRTVLVGRSNTRKRSDGYNEPLVRNCAIILEDGNVYNAQCRENPLQELRRSRFMADDAAANVFDRKKCEMIISRFMYHHDPKSLKAYLSMDDAELLRQLSTSPKAEAPDYCVGLKAALSFILQNRPEVFWQQNPSIRLRNINGNWERIR